MSAITTLRKALRIGLNEAEDRTTGVLEVTEGAVETFVIAIFDAFKITVNQVIGIVFDLANMIVTEVFIVADTVVTTALGEVEAEDTDSIVGNDLEGSN